MCGIFGWQAENLSPQQRAILGAVLAVENDRRGGDSWGLVDKNLDIKKGLGDLADEITGSWYGEQSQVIAHTRAASTGEVSIANAHPFEAGWLIGAHNGIVSNHVELNARHKRSCAVDSEHIFCHIAEEKPLEELEGWGAIEYISKTEPESIILGRFLRGDLAVVGIGEHVRCHGVIWSSNRESLVTACNLAGVKHFPFAVENGKSYKVKNGTLWEHGDLPIRESDLWRKWDDWTTWQDSERSRCGVCNQLATDCQYDARNGFFVCDTCLLCEQF